MAKSTLLESGEITEVYYRFGTYQDGNSGKPKFIKAPFDLVKMGTDEYVQPMPIGGHPVDYATIFSGTLTATEYYMARRDFGFVNGNPVMVGEHEMGDTSDGWKGLHFFDQL